VRQFQRILRQPFSPQRQGFQTEQQRERLMRSQALPLIAQSVEPRLENERQRSESLHDIQTVIAGRRLAEQRVTTVIPGEIPAIHDQTADGCAVPADPFGRRVNHDAGASLDRPEQITADAKSIVHHDRNPGLLRRSENHLEIGDVQRGIADGFDEPDAGTSVTEHQEFLQAFSAACEAGLNAQTRQGDFQLVVAAAIEKVFGGVLIAFSWKPMADANRRFRSPATTSFCRSL
jgi:hypothetical protein